MNLALIAWISLSSILCVAGAPAKPRQVAITFDDLPATHGDLREMCEVTAKVTRQIRAEKIPAVGFVNEHKLFKPGEIDERVALLAQWLDAGAELGNHSFSHVAIDRVPLEQYKEDVIRGETVTAKLLEARGRRLRYYRHTQLRTGRTREYRDALNEWLASRGYVVAPVTIDNNDYIVARVYDDALRRDDAAAMQTIAAAYVAYLEEVTAHFETISKDLLGYEVPQVLLLHANALNADHLDRVVAMYRARGYRFVSLEDALKDPAYRLPEAVSRRGLSWLHRWSLARGQPMKPEPPEPPFIRERFDELTARPPRR